MTAGEWLVLSSSPQIYFPLPAPRLGHQIDDAPYPRALAQRYDRAMDTDMETLLQDILARCAAEAAACLSDRKNKDIDYRAIEVRMAASMAHASARLVDSLARLKKQAPKRGSKRI